MRRFSIDSAIRHNEASRLMRLLRTDPNDETAHAWCREEFAKHFRPNEQRQYVDLCVQSGRSVEWVRDEGYELTPAQELSVLTVRGTTPWWWQLLQGWFTSAVRCCVRRSASVSPRRYKRKA